MSLKNEGGGESHVPPSRSTLTGEPWQQRHEKEMNARAREWTLKVVSRFQRERRSASQKTYRDLDAAVHHVDLVLASDGRLPSTVHARKCGDSLVGIVLEVSRDPFEGVWEESQGAPRCLGTIPKHLRRSPETPWDARGEASDSQWLADWQVIG